MKYINSNSILYDYQFGFRVKHSTNLALPILTNNITTALDNGNCVLGLFLDFSKAFDIIDHGILLSKLQGYRISGTALKLINSFLSNRYQNEHVGFNGNASSRPSISCGIPQGSVLGPLLFLLYINDIALVSNLLFLLLFADESNVFVTGRDIDAMIDQVNTEMAKIVPWLNANKLTLNMRKTHFIVFKTAKKHISSSKSVLINNHPIKQVTTTKFLGIIIDSSLSWCDHILAIKGKASRGIGILSKTRRYFNYVTLRTLYYSIIYPYLH